MAEINQVPAKASPLSRAIERASTDPDFRKRLIADPKAALAEVGAVIPEKFANVTLKVVENTPTTIHIVLPATHADGDLDDAALGGVAGGVRPLGMELEEALIT